MPYPSPQLFNIALKYLYHLQTKIHYKYIVNNINDGAAREVIETLLNDGLIRRVDNSDYYKITEIGRDVVNGGGYQPFADAKKYHGIGTTLSNAGMGTSLRATLKQDKDEAFNASRKRYVDALDKVVHPKVSRWKKIRKGVSSFLQHWFVEKYLKLIIMALLTLLIGYFGKLYLEEHFPK